MVQVLGSGKQVSLKEAKEAVDKGKARLTNQSPAEIEFTVGEPRSPIEVRGTKRPKGVQPFGPFFQAPIGGGRDISVSPQQLRRVYRFSSAVGSAVDFIRRTISTIPWRVVSQPGVRKRDFDFAVELLSRPGMGVKTNTFSKFLSLQLYDLLVLDQVYVEKIRARGGSLTHLEPRDAATFLLEEDDRGDIVGYKQGQETGKPIEFNLEDILYYVWYPRTDSNYGTPRIEKVLSEVTALLLGTDAIAAFFSDNEIPPGLLHLGEIGLEMAERAKEDFESNRGAGSNRKMIVIGGRGDPRWIQLRRPFKEMEIASLIPRMERAIWRVFGIAPLDVGMSADLNRSTAEAQERVRNFNLIKPLLDLLAEEITFNILHEIDERLFLEFIHFARIGEGGAEAFTTIDTDIPGEGEGSDVDRASPLFGAGRFLKNGMHPIFSSTPARMPLYSGAPFMPRASTEEALTFLDENTKKCLRQSIDAANEAVGVVLGEGLSELQDMVTSGIVEPHQLRVQIESMKEDTLNQVLYSLRAAESSAVEYAKQFGDFSYSPCADSLLEDYERKFDEIITDQVLNPSFPTIEEEVSLIRFLDSELLNTEDIIKKAASAPVLSIIDN